LAMLNQSFEMVVSQRYPSDCVKYYRTQYLPLLLFIPNRLTTSMFLTRSIEQIMSLLPSDVG